jgi:integrase
VSRARVPARRRRAFKRAYAKLGVSSREGFFHALTIRSRGLIPAQLKAGVTVASGNLDDDGQPILAAKYTGLHALRHFYASWSINRVADGGLGLPLKVVQERMGHASVVMTSDVYGHLFPSGDDGEEMAAPAGTRPRARGFAPRRHR